VDNDVPGVREAARRLAQVPNHVLYTPEWVGGGVAELREQVHEILTRLSAGPTTRTGAQPDPKVIERADAFLSETSVMRWISDILGGSGTVSPDLGDGFSAGLDRGIRAEGFADGRACRGWNYFAICRSGFDFVVPGFREGRSQRGGAGLETNRSNVGGSSLGF